MAENKKSKLPISIFELVIYCLCLLLGLWGLVYISLGVAVNFLPYDHAIVKYDASIASSSTMGLLFQGLLILSCAVLPAVVVLLVFAKTADREYEKEQRRKQARMSRFKTTVSENETVVEVESEPAE